MNCHFVGLIFLLLIAKNHNLKYNIAVPKNSVQSFAICKVHKYISDMDGPWGNLTN